MIQSFLLNFKETLLLIILNIKTRFINSFEYIKIVFKYYQNLLFLKIDINLLKSYFFKNPFLISKEFLIKKNVKDVYTYGETPLTTLEKVARNCQIHPKDVVFELGCGRGRTCFWLNIFIGCEVKGVDHVPIFIEKAKAIKEKFELKKIDFYLDDLFKINLSEATVIYLYGSCFSDEEIEKLVKKFSKLTSGTKIITVSYSLRDLDSTAPFKILQIFPAQFTWGTADVFLQIKL